MSWRFFTCPAAALSCPHEVHNSHRRVAAQRDRWTLEEGFRAIAQHAGRQALHRHQRLELAEQQDEVERWEAGQEEDGKYDTFYDDVPPLDIKNVAWEPRLLVQQRAEAHLNLLQHQASLLEVAIGHNQRMQEHALDLLDQDMENIVEAEPADEIQEKEDEKTLANSAHIVMPVSRARSWGWSDFCEGLDDALRLTVTEKTNEFCYSGPKLVKVRGGKYSLAQLSAGEICSNCSACACSGWSGGRREY